MTAKYLAIALSMAPIVFGQQPSGRDETPSQQPEIQTMQQAIAFERHKDAAAERQARIEERKTTRNSASRSMEERDRSRQQRRQKLNPATPDK